MPRYTYIQKVFAALIIHVLPFLKAQTLYIFRPNQTYSDIVCHEVSRGTKSRVIRETQCARCYRDDPSCVAFHYSEKDRTCHFYNLTVFGAIFEELCDDAPGFKFYMQDGAIDDFWNSQVTVNTMLPTAIVSMVPSAALYIDYDAPLFALGQPVTAVTGQPASTTNEVVSPSTTPEPTSTISGSDWEFHLVDGTSSNNGRIEVVYNGQRAQLCDYYFNSDQADQICAALGLSTHGLPIYGGYFGDNPFNYVMQQYDCNADHTWCNALYIVTAICNSAGVGCNDSPDFRLADGNWGYDGRIEINLAGVWGTVCGMGLHGDGDAQDLLCQEAGSYSRSDVAGFIPGTGPIWLQYVSCDIAATSIMDCTIEQQPSCDHTYDLSMYCS